MTGILSCLFFSVLLFGAAHTWVSLASAAFIFLLSFLHSDRILESARRLPGFVWQPCALVFLWLLLQTHLFSLERWTSQNHLLQWAAIALAFLSVQSFSESSIKNLLLGIVGLGCLESAYGLYEVLSGSERVLWHAKQAHQGFVTGTYLNRNHFAGFIEICLGIQTGRCLAAAHEKKIKNLVIEAAVFLLLLAGLIQSGSRGGNAGFLISAVLFFLIVFLKARKKAWIPVFAACGILAAAFWSGREILFLRFQEMGQADRWLVWRSALRILKEYLGRGTGLGTFEWIFPAFQPGRLVLNWEHAHNDYLELIIEIGLPAFLIFTGTLLIVFWKNLQKWFSREMNSGRLMQGGCRMGLAAFAIHGFFDFNFAIFANTLTWFVAAATVIRRPQ